MYMYTRIVKCSTLYWYYTSTDRCKCVVLCHITEAGGGRGRRTVSTIAAIGQTVVIATVVKEVQMRRQKRCTCKRKKIEYKYDWLQ